MGRENKLIEIQSSIIGENFKENKTVYFDEASTIVFSRISSDNLTISVSEEGDVDIKEIGVDKYIICPKKLTSRSGFYNIIMTKKLGVYPLRVRFLPEPEIRLTNYKNQGTVSADQMKLRNGLMSI